MGFVLMYIGDVLTHTMTDLIFPFLKHYHLQVEFPEEFSLVSHEIELTNKTKQKTGREK